MLQACIHRSETPEPVVEAPVVEAPVVEAPVVEEPVVEEPSEGRSEPPGTVTGEQLKAGLEALMQTEGAQLASANRQQWPPTEWTRARAYTYNFVPYGPGHQLRVWDESGWSDAIVQTFELTQQQAEVAAELTHRTQGDVPASKCAFPRHAVVFFDEQDQPLASVNICFECTDILVWPPYFEDESLSDSRFENAITVGEDGEAIEMPLLFTVHEQVLSSWERFFYLAGAEQFAR
jgi:hypothetical protein